MVRGRSGASFLVVRGKYGARFLAGTWHDFVSNFKKIGAKQTCIDIKRVIVKLDVSLATQQTVNRAWPAYLKLFSLSLLTFR